MCAHTLGLASVFCVSASKRLSGSVRSQSLYLAGKSMEYTWPITEVMRNRAGRPLN